MKVNGSPFFWVCFAMVVGVMGTALISPLYALYQQAWQLKPSDVSLVYVIYMGGALCGLLFLGRLPDRLGFLPIMRGGLILALIGTLGTLFAWDLTSLSVGRFVVGVSSSMLTTSAALGLALLVEPEKKHRLSLITSIAMALGFGLGPLVGGIFGQWMPQPLTTTYLPTLALCGIALLVLARLDLPEGASGSGKPFQLRDVLPRLTWPDRHASFAFILTVCLAFLYFAIFGLYASLSPLFLNKLVPWHGPVVSGTAITVILFGSAFTQILCGRLHIHWSGSLGLIVLSTSNILLMANLWIGSAILFFLGVALTAIGHGMCQLAGINMVGRIATPDTRAGLFSSFMVIGYVGSMLPMMGIGWIADHWGMNTALYIFCTGATLIAVTVAVLFQRHPLTQPRKL
jgi:MFS family permease